MTIQNKLNYALCIIIHIMHIDPSHTTINYETKIHSISSIKNLPTFYSKNNVSSIYNQKGELTCKLITKYIKYSNNIKSTYFIQPIIILFNKNNIPSWNIQAKQAKIINHKIVYLYGNVQINNLKHNTYLQCITTNKAILNLATHDIFSNEMVTVYNISSQAIAKNIRGNLYTNIIELQKTIYTINETKNL